MQKIITSEEIKAIICKIFLGGDMDFPIEDEMDLLATGICDSMGLAILALELERRNSNLKIFDAEIIPENFGSVSRIKKYLEIKNN